MDAEMKRSDKQRNNNKKIKRKQLNWFGLVRHLVKMKADRTTGKVIDAGNTIKKRKRKAENKVDESNKGSGRETKKNLWKI